MQIYVARQEFVALKRVLAAGAVTLVAPYAVSWIRISLLKPRAKEVDEIIPHDFVARCSNEEQTVQMPNPFYNIILNEAKMLSILQLILPSIQTPLILQVFRSFLNVSRIARHRKRIS